MKTPHIVKKNKNNIPIKERAPIANSTFNKTILLWLVGIILLTYIAFSPSLKNGFTNWDDIYYVGNNPLITNLSSVNLKKIFSIDEHVALNYHPVTILSFALDYQLSGYNPKTYHITNLLFHLFNTVLVFWFIFLLSEKKLMVAAIVALFFGIHPMHVESVAWISERKDVLYVFFFMSALICYLKFLNVEGKDKVKIYAFMLLLFLFSVLSKAMAVVLPLVFLLIDYYLGRKFDKKSIIEKIPFFGISLFLGVIAYNIQSEAAISKFEILTWQQHLLFPCYGIVQYIYKLFVPINLSCFYPYPNLGDNVLPYVFYLCPIIILVLVILIFISLKKNKILFFGALFFFITIALVLQFVSVGKVIMADRYSYLSYIGLLFPIAMGYDWLQNRTDKKNIVYKQLSKFSLIVVAIISIWLTFERCKVWKNSDILWTDVIEKYPNCESAYSNRGSYLVNKAEFEKGQKNIGQNEYERALSDLTISIKLNPIDAKVFLNRANIYGLKGNMDMALRDYSKAIELDRTNDQIFFNRAVTYGMMKQFDKAIEDYNTVLSMKPDLISAKRNRAYAYFYDGNYSMAIPNLNELIQLDPTNINNYHLRGAAYFSTGDFTAALKDNDKLIQLNLINGDTYLNRSLINKSLGKYKDALNDALKAQSLGYVIDANYLHELKSKVL